MSSREPLVSIIVPVYGVELYIRDCLDSISCQTYQNLEVLVVDDGSPDQSGAILDEYEKQDCRIIVFHIENRGAAGARNVALNHCSGDYIMFVDGDDWLESRCVELMLGTIQKEQCDLVQCQFYKNYLNREIKVGKVENSVRLSGQTFLKELLFSWENALTVNKIFPRELVSDIRFKEGHCIDDEFFTYHILMRANSVFIIPDCLYHYRQRKSSAMKNTQKKIERLSDRLEYAEERYINIYKMFPGMEKELLSNLVTTLMQVMCDSEEYSEIYYRAKNSLKKYGLKALLHKEIEIGLKKSIVVYLLSKRKLPSKFSSAMKDEENEFFA